MSSLRDAYERARDEEMRATVQRRVRQAQAEAAKARRFATASIVCSAAGVVVQIIVRVWS